MATNLPVGKPAIARPSDASPGVGQTIDNIRARFVALEQALARLTVTTGAADQTFASQIAALRAQIAQILQAIALLQQQTGGGGGIVTRTFAAAEALEAGWAVWISGDGAVSAIDPDDPLACSGFVGVTASAASEGEDVDVRIPGGVVEVPGASFVAGAPVYAGSAAECTQAPAGNPLAVGVALDETQLAVAAGTVALSALGFDANEDSMLASVGLVREIAAGGGILPVVNGEVPPVLVYLDDGSLVYTRIE